MSAVNFGRQHSNIALSSATQIISGVVYSLDEALRSSAVALDSEAGERLSLKGRSALLIEIENKHHA